MSLKVYLKIAPLIIFLWAGLGALYITLYNPPVPLAEPLVIPLRPQGPLVTVMLGGDFAPTDAAMAKIRRHGYRYPYLGTDKLMREADIAFANLEAPVTSSLKRFPFWKRYFYRVEPEAVAAWRWLGLDAVSLANNHLRDYRDEGMADTLHHLKEGAIPVVGAGEDESQARRPLIFHVGGTRVGFLAYLEHRAMYGLYLRTFALGDLMGCAQLNPRDLAEDVRRLRPLVDILIVSVHWGDNYGDVNATQEEHAALMADLGVDVVAGHHAHDVQAVETRGRTVILYSLGNYAWGAPGHGHMRIGLLAQLSIDPRTGRLASLELIPLATQNRMIRYQPRPLRPSEMKWTKPLIDASAGRGTRLRVEGTRLRVPLP